MLFNVNFSYLYFLIRIRSYFKQKRYLLKLDEIFQKATNDIGILGRNRKKNQKLKIHYEKFRNAYKA